MRFHRMGFQSRVPHRKFKWNHCDKIPVVCNPPSSLNGATRLEEDTMSLLFDQYCFLQSDLNFSLKSDPGLASSSGILPGASSTSQILV